MEHFKMLLHYAFKDLYFNYGKSLQQPQTCQYSLFSSGISINLCM